MTGPLLLALFLYLDLSLLLSRWFVGTNGALFSDKSIIDEQADTRHCGWYSVCRIYGVGEHGISILVRGDTQSNNDAILESHAPMEF